MLVREFQRVISTEARAQVLDRYGRLPDAVAACVGGGSNALGIFADFIDDAEVALYGFEAGGDGVETGRHAATISAGSVGVLHGMRTFVLQDEDGQTRESHSISAGLDYPGVGPEHSWLAEAGRAHYSPVTDAEAMEALPAAGPDRGHRPGHRVRPRPGRCAHARRERLPARADGQPPLILVNLSGRGDKDVDTAIKWFDIDTSGTGSESGERIDASAALPPVELELGGSSTGAARSVSRPEPVELSTAQTAGHTGRRFAEVRASGRGALVGFLHVGYPDVPTSLARPPRR